MNGCKVISPGFYTTLQDEGRLGFRHWGIPKSGAMDAIHFEYANAIVGNSKEKTALECTLEGPTLLCNQATVIAVTGAPMRILKNEAEVPMNTAIPCDLGDILQFGKMSEGMRSYIAFQGGLGGESYLGSRSYFHPVTPQATLVKGQVLALLQESSNGLKQNDFTEPLWPSKNSVAFEAEEGPDWFHLPEDFKAALKETTYQVGSNNRMGYQLEGFPLEHQLQLPSGLVLPGTVQLTPNGKLLIAMADGQVTGGYPRVLLLGKEDIATLAQLRTGATVKISPKRG